VDRRLAQRLLSALAHPISERALEALGLLDVKALEVARLGVAFEQAERLRDGVDRGIAQASRVAQMVEVPSLNSLVCCVVL